MDEEGVPLSDDAGDDREGDPHRDEQDEEVDEDTPYKASEEVSVLCWVWQHHLCVCVCVCVLIKLREPVCTYELCMS